VFIISSRPLTPEAYLNDPEEIDEDDLPPLLKFDVLYYYKTAGYNSDEVSQAGEIKIIDMDNIKINSEKENSHSFKIEAKSKNYEFFSSKRYVIEQWVDALELS